MTNVDDIYYCEICGNTVRVLESGEGVLVCCGEDMVQVGD
jgi:desulfoferrodoxin-like iron-binding protein